MRKIGRKTVRQFSEKGWPTRGGFLYNMNTYLIHDPLLWRSERRAALLRFVTKVLQKPTEIVVLMCEQ